MQAHVLAALSLVLLAGCHSQIVESGGGTTIAEGTRAIDVEVGELPPADGVYRDDARDAATTTYSSRQLADLPIGQPCTVELASDRVIRGRISRASKDVLVLSDAEEIIAGTHETGVPMMSNIPYVQRMFKNVGTTVDYRYLGSETLSAFEIKTVAVQPPGADSRARLSSAQRPDAGE